MGLRIRDKIKNRYVLWPIRFAWAKTRNDLFDWHSWVIGGEKCKIADTAIGMEVGYRGVLGQTLHIGRLHIIFGHK